LAEEESGFTFVDKRKPAASEEPQASEAPTEQTAPTAAPETELEVEGDEEQRLPHLTVRDRLLMCIDILNQGAWISLGLLSDPSTGQIEKDLPQAKVAIDCLRLLAEKVEADLDDVTRRELKSLLNDLQVNFVQQSSR
jgi:hypothetical protein